MEEKHNSHKLTNSDKQWITEHIEDDSVSVSENDTYKQTTNFYLNSYKIKLIEELKTFNYQTPIFKIADNLKELFIECQSKPFHWAYIAEHYSPKTINSTLSYMAKAHGDWKNIENPAAYFTQIIKYRPKRKRFRYTNDTR